VKNPLGRPPVAVLLRKNAWLFDKGSLSRYLFRAMSYIFYVLAALLIAQGVFSLIEGIHFRSFVRRSLRKSAQVTFAPASMIIAPCKGVDRGLEENVRALFALDYPNYEIVFAIASSDDPCRPLIERLIDEHPASRARIVVAGQSSRRGEKVNNLMAAVESAGPDIKALVFVDLDARVPVDWLKRLVAPLVDGRVGASTGYRWYVPERGGFWSALLSAWNGSVATTLGDHRRNFAWGGSTAILRETFDTIGVRERWKEAVSDDYALTSAVQDAGLRVTFEPSCMVPSLEDATLKSLIEFTTRQVTITRVYRPMVWWTGLISHLMFNAGFFGGIALVVSRALSGSVAVAALVALAVIFALGSIKGWLRIDSAAAAVQEAGPAITQLWWMFCLLWPLVSVLFLYNFFVSSMTRRITWRGVVYEMKSPSKTIVIR
jgi:ceramide glucosyltransferase